MPPLVLRGNFEILMSNLLLNYLINRNKFDLKDALWKLQIGKSQQLGTNLPILASGLETLAAKYLKSKGVLKQYTEEEMNKYKELIEHEKNEIENKLSEYQFLTSILNKIDNPTNYSIGEKTKLFLNDIGFNFDGNTVERKALQERNNMAHGSMSNLSEKKWIKYVKLTNAYITVYNRIILRLIGFNGKYIDYYSVGFPELEINENIKEK